MNKILFSFVFLLNVALFANAETDFFRACLNGEIEKVEKIYEKEGVSMTYARDKDGNTPLHLAACSKKGGNKKEIVEFLISKGVDVNTSNHFESTPLHIAVSNGNYEATKLLLNAKEIRVNHPLEKKFTPLHIAVINRIPPIIKLLLSHPETNPNFGTGDGATPLHFAAMKGFVEEAKLLIEDPRTDVNAAQHDSIYSGATPLHFAAMQAQADIVATLLERSDIQVNATINKGPHEGFTPLHFVVMNPDTVNVFESVKLLIKAGCNPKAKCKAGKTPMDLTAVTIIQGVLKNPKKKYNSRKK